jgi:hypothetical protein
MEMVVVEHVGARPEHGAEMAACAYEHLAQELLLLRLPAPAAQDRDLAPVRQDEG